MLNNLIYRIKLPFLKEKELYSALYDILGFYPKNIHYYKLALMHKSIMKREKGKPLNNERLEFLGDAVLDAVVGDIVYRHFEKKREGFLTNTRSKIVQRETLNKLAQELGITQLVLTSGSNTSHNSYLGGNAFEALFGAIYLDRGYDACMRFMDKRILTQYINLDKVAYKEVNFKSKLIEWSQKHRVQLEFRLMSQDKDRQGSPVFLTTVFLEGIQGETAKGFSKKESHQLAAKATLQQLKKKPQFIDAVLAAKSDRMNEARAKADADALKRKEKEEQRAKSEEEKKDESYLRETRRVIEEGQKQRQAKPSGTDNEEFDLSDIQHDFRQPTREDIIAAAEQAAFQGAE